MENKSKILVLAISVAVIICSILAAGCTSTNNTNSAASTDESSTNLQIDQTAGEYVKPVTGEMVIPNVTYMGFAKMTIPQNNTEIEGIDFYNPEQNAGYFNQTFEIVLENGESLYKSGLVEPGKHIQKFTLNHGLNPGTYKAYLRIQPYLIGDTNTPLSNGEVAFVLEVV